MSVFIRILLRYGAAALVAHGMLTPEDGNMLAADPELAMLIETALGGTAAAAAEVWFWLSKRVAR